MIGSACNWSAGLIADECRDTFDQEIEIVGIHSGVHGEVFHAE